MNTTFTHRRLPPLRRWWLGCAVALATTACPRQESPGYGEAQAASRPVSTEVRTAPPPPPTDDLVSSDEVIGPLRTGIEVPLLDAPLTGFFRALRELQENRRTKVRIAFFGDSHTAADMLTTALRRTLQERFGDGGRGFVHIGTPWRSYLPKDVSVDNAGPWVARRHRIGADPATMDGLYGMGGIRVESAQRGATCTVATDTQTPFGATAATFQVFFLRRPGGGKFSVFADGRTKTTVDTNGSRLDFDYATVRLPEGRHRFGVRTRDNRPVYFLGAALESARPGVVVDVLGVNGAFFSTPLHWDRALLSEQMALRNPQLVVTMYGTNDAGSKSLTPATYGRTVRRSLDRLMQGAPEADCLVIGPPDQDAKTPARLERLDWIIRVQQEAATQKGCGFIDLRTLMGGPGTHARWQHLNPAYAQKDGVHYTAPGYAVLGQLIAEQLLASWPTESSGAPEERDRR